ncbi:antibiotic biosynthesis monooxygenase [Ketobacter sp. MCCC 1A13808]|uniref:putative quinol monooxygenase n=1 Tax=Ketobacter sp. MCCC 1A13808 TaxID=2602738 RepID=UPI000F236B66|nr:antibiotic biosynthesis monooxygenase family protein [Ketobacter sp. MCCC 1A13808]MVF13578.1 antibiotic biosynthesis monooxygenase [Ketobacter sp. MCCC 1A13808]RLP53317.1 MAG: antibiotic biosynthesis monooxygenase [Ketobacter sp.]
MSYQLIVQFKVKDGKADQFVEIMQNAKSRIAEAPGCQGVEVLLSADNPNKVVLSEVWETTELHDQYAAKMRESGSMDQMATFLDGMPESEIFEIK